MKNWTTQAEQRLTEYLRYRAAREGFTGEDAAELQDDLRRHIHEEAEQSDAETIGLMNLEQLLGRLDAGYQPPQESRRAPEFSVKSARGGFLNWTFGVILPLAVLLLELVSSFCGSAMFDPTPTWWHTVWIAMVPLLNGWLLSTRGQGGMGQGAAAGFALFTAGFYGLLFLPVAHWALLGVIFFGLGLLPLSPLLATLFSWRIGRQTKRDAAAPGRFKSGWRFGALAAVTVAVALESPGLWTRANLATATTDSKGAEAAIARLRAAHSEDTLLRACYEANGFSGRPPDISGWIYHTLANPVASLGMSPGRTPDAQAIRDVFFRVTGKPFNSLKPPAKAGIALGRQADPLEEFEFDEDLGGDEVALRLKNLDLTESRLDGHVDSVSRLGYGEWTMVFKNRSGQEKEARCQVRLPRGGHVSRLTLWVNGEPREAAFSTVAKVKAAYKAVAVVQRRDPVLVNMVGPDTVMVQCFPVPARGEMKIRLGITAPLDGGRWELPSIVERNFGIAHGLEHAVWLQADCGFDLGGTQPAASVRDGSGHSLPISLGNETLTTPGVVIRTVPLAEEPEVVWCEDRFAKPEERYLIREPVSRIQAAARQVVVVIDGSISLRAAKDWIGRSLAAQDKDKLIILLADDHARRVTLPELQSHRFTGGRDNEPALKEAIRLARESGAPIVWIHGPQAVKLSQPEALLQSLERGTVHPIIHDVEAVAGPNRLAEAIYRTGCLRRGPSLISPENDLTRLVQDLLTEHRQAAWNWKRAVVEDGLPGKRVWDQLARSWAAGVVDAPSSQTAGTDLSALAASYQLVTPVSGAVVLETQQQYKDHGLTPVDPSAAPAIPAVPEPSTSLLVVLTTAAALFRRNRIA